MESLARVAKTIVIGILMVVARLGLLRRLNPVLDKHGIGIASKTVR